MSLTGTRSLSLSFFPEAGQIVSRDGFSCFVFDSGVCEGCQKDYTIAARAQNAVQIAKYPLDSYQYQLCSQTKKNGRHIGENQGANHM